jgi:hypothetical protein
VTKADLRVGFCISAQTIYHGQLVHNEYQKSISMLEINPLLNLIKDLRERSQALRGYL